MFLLCCVHIYISPPYQDKVLEMLDRDQDHFGISSYEENEIDLNLGIIIRVGFQVQCEQCVYFLAMLFSRYHVPTI